MEFFSNTFTKLAINALGTGFGIIIGNSIVKYFVHQHDLREAEKIFAFAIEQQLSSLSALIDSLDKIRFAIEQNYDLLSNVQEENLEKSKIQFDAQNNVIAIQQIIEQILDDDFHKQLLGDQKIFESSVMEITGKYFSTLQKNLINLKLFFSDRFSIGNSEKNFYWDKKEIILSTLDQFITQLEATIDKGAIGKIVLDKKQNFKQKNESKKLAERFYHNTDCSRYCVREQYLAQQEFDEIKNFIDQNCSKEEVQ